MAASPGASAKDWDFTPAAAAANEPELHQLPQAPRPEAEPR